MHNGRKLCKKKGGFRKIVILSPWGTLMVVLVIILVFYAPASSERIAAIERHDSAEGKLAKLEALLTPSSESLAEDMAVFAALLSIPGGERYSLPSLAPQQLKERTLGALIAHLKRLSARQPMVLVFEDLHWTDPTTLELLGRVIEQAPELPLLVLVTARPGVLHHVADAATQLDGILLQNAVFVDLDVTAGRLDHAIDHAQECGLSAPGGADEDRRLARRDDEAEVLHRTRAVGELLGDALELDHWLSSVANPTDAGLEWPNRCNGAK